MNGEFDIDDAIKSLLKNGKIKPEPECHNISKFLSLKTSGANESEKIVHLCNSFGIQLFNDIKFFEAANNGEENCAPVIKEDHLKMLDNHEELVNKLRELPSEWTILQISREFEATSVVCVMKQPKETDPTLLITRLTCGTMVDRVPPYCIRVPPPDNVVCEGNIMERLNELLKARREYYTNRRDGKIKNMYNSSDAGLASCLNEIETYWLREWKCLFNGRLVNEKLEKEIKTKISGLLQDVSRKTTIEERKSIDLLYLLIISLHALKPREIVKALKKIVYGGGKPVDSEELAILMDEVKSIGNRYAEAIKSTQRHPVIIISEPFMELFAWEMTTTLLGQPVSRILSFNLLYGLYKYHETRIVDGYMKVPVNSAFCLLNPDKTLDSCEKQMGEFFQKDLPWVEVFAGQIPDQDDLISKLGDKSVFMFCGHGSASQFYKVGGLKKALVNGIVLLYGCSSNLPRGRGGRTPYQNDTYTYLTNGCPCLIGSLYDITSSDADRASIRMLSSMLPTVSSGQGVTSPSEPNVLRAVLLGKEACSKFWSKCCFVARGLPAKIIFTDEEKDGLLRNVQKRK